MIMIFFVGWLALSKVDWITIFKIEQINKNTEEKLGDLFWDLFNKPDNEIHDRNIKTVVDSLLTRICESNSLDQTKIKLHIVKNDEINAFALPDNHLVLFSSLIIDCENEEELCGVLCHELAHIELDHVMKKLVKEIGLSVLLTVATGNSSGEIIKEAARILSSTAYDRKLERAADKKAIDFLMNANINPEPFASFLYRLSEGTSEIESHLAWISTHPDSKERAEYIIEYCRNKSKNFKPVVTIESWERLKEDLEKI